MRRRLLPKLPRLMKFYPGFHPELLDTLPRREVELLVTAMDQYLAEQPRG